MTNPVLILPGWYGSGPEHWQRWLGERTPGARVVEQDNWAHPDLDSWLGRLETAIGDAGAPVILVGHSLGVILAIHHAAEGGKAVAGALLVAPGDADLHAATEPDLVTFAPVPRAKLPYPAILVASRNDPHMDYRRTVALAADLGAELVDLGDAGHINVDAGYGPWPGAVELLDRLRTRIAETFTQDSSP